MANQDQNESGGVYIQGDQIRGMLDRVGLVLGTMLLSWAQQRGYISASDVGILLPGLMLVPALMWGWWINRNKALLQSVARSVPDTVVVTTPELAKDIPDANVVSNVEKKVVNQ